MEVGSSSLPGTTMRCMMYDVRCKRLYPSTISNQPSSFYFGGLAQLARAPALQAGGQRFESVILHHAVPDIPEIPDVPVFHPRSIFDILTQARL